MSVVLVRPKKRKGNGPFAVVADTVQDNGGTDAFVKVRMLDDGDERYYRVCDLEEVTLANLTSEGGKAGFRHPDV